MTQAPSLVALFIPPLNRSGIAYMVTGGLAAVIYGHPRLTLDIDLVVRLTAIDAVTLTAAWSQTDFYVPPVEVMIEESQRSEHGHFNIIHKESAMRADVYIAGSNDLNTWAFQRRLVRTVDGEEVQLAPIEAVILGKLRYFALGGSDRHLRDVARIVEISGSIIDRPALDRWLERLSLRGEWTKALKYGEPD